MKKRSCTTINYFKIYSETFRNILKDINKEIIVEDDKISIFYKDNKGNALIFDHFNNEGWDFQLTNVEYINNGKSINIIIDENLSNGLYSKCFIDSSDLDKIEFNDKILFIEDNELKIQTIIK